MHTADTSRARGTVVQAHGITVDKDEGGMFVRLAERLAKAGFTVIRFSFRGHGKSDGAPEGVTIAGEMLDLQAVVKHAMEVAPGPLAVIAASFGAVPTALLLPTLEMQLHRLVLWNPVLDLDHTFLHPELPWGTKNFGPGPQRQLHEQGRLLIDDEFPIGQVLWQELARYDPLKEFSRSQVPALVIHGDHDSYVSYDIARAAAEERNHTEFRTIEGSDHGFDSRDREDEAIGHTLTWLTAGDAA
ncbi:alpha/beta hydrolase [Nocardiopsis rhodophaea]